MTQVEFVSKLNVGLAAALVVLSACTPEQFSSSPQTLPNDPGTQSIPPSPTARSSETFFQNSSAGKVDVLFVIDNSFSMQSLQAKVASRFGSIVSSLSDIDYHIGLTTTDLDSKNYDIDGRLQPWTGLGSTVLTPLVLAPDLIFTNSVIRHETLSCTTLTYECPSGNSQPLKATIRAIQQKAAANSGFFRDDVPLAVVALTNEDELGDGVTPTTAQDSGAPLTPTPASAVTAAVTAVFGAGKKFMFNGIIVQPGDSACLTQQRNDSVQNGAYFGSHLLQAAQNSGGSTYSICDADYGQSLKDISNRVRDLLSSFDLKKAPAAGSLKVVLTPSVNIGYRIEGQKLIFETPPPVGTKIDVTYN